MQAKDLKPAGTLALKYGAKCIIYGPPGSSKTPVLNTAPRPVLLATEPGLLSMRDSTLPTWEAYTPAKIEEFFQWFFNSNESKAYDTLAIDSGSQTAEIVLTDKLNSYKDGRKAFGEMSRTCMGWFDQLFFMPQKHVVLLCKQMRVEVGSAVVRNPEGGFTVEMKMQTQPFFPGNDLNIKVPHRYDEILHMSKIIVPGQGPKPVPAIRAVGTDEIMARDRSGKLAEIEPPHLGQLFAKIMS